jgi:hypothetical protein
MLVEGRTPSSAHSLHIENANRFPEPVGSKKQSMMKTIPQFHIDLPRGKLPPTLSTSKTRIAPPNRWLKETSIVKAVAELPVDLPRPVPVESTERQTVVELHAADRDIDRCHGNRPSGRKPEVDLISSRNMQDHFNAATGFTWSYSGFFHSSL